VLSLVSFAVHHAYFPNIYTDLLDGARSRYQQEFYNSCIAWPSIQRLFRRTEAQLDDFVEQINVALTEGDFKSGEFWNKHWKTLERQEFTNEQCELLDGEGSITGRLVLALSAASDDILDGVRIIVLVSFGTYSSFVYCSLNPWKRYF